MNLKNVVKLYDSKETCKVIRATGFHVQELFAVTSLVSSLTDCLQVCFRKHNCYSVNYVLGVSTFPHGDEQGQNRCFLSATSADNFQVLHSMYWSTYASFSCPEENNRPRPFPTMFHGTSPRQCGILAFAHPPPALLSPQEAPVFNRVIAGTKAPPYSQPWLGQVVHSADMICGVSLINNKEGESATLFAISAAHCFYNTLGEIQPKASFGFLFGVHDLRYPSAHSVYRTARQIFVHGLYDSQRDNDVAIVKFKDKVLFNDYVRPICLPDVLSESAAPSAADPPVGLACSVCGYGTESINLETDRPVRPSVPKCFKTKLSLPHFRMSRKIKLTHAGFYFSFADRVRYKGTSEGDSGGAVACLVNSQFTIYGVVAGFGDSKADQFNVANIFTRVPFFLSWILNAMEVNDDLIIDHPLPVKIDFEVEPNEISTCFSKC